MCSSDGIDLEEDQISIISANSLGSMEKFVKGIKESGGGTFWRADGCGAAIRNYDHGITRSHFIYPIHKSAFSKNIGGSGGPWWNGDRRKLPSGGLSN